jgi:hypothetical protein
VALVALGLLIASVAGIRQMLARARGKTEEEDMPLLVFHDRNRAPLSSTDAARPAVDSAVPRPPGTPLLHSAPDDSPAGVPMREEGTLQLLPGRLELASGNDRMKEIRFVKMPGPAIVTFGRFPGDTHKHVQVDSPTVSRLHASMRFASGRWHIKNLSDTNPTIVNGHPLPATAYEQTLNDGDLVEMGEVIFRFRAR